MDYRIAWSPTSRDDLRKIVAFILEDNPAAALKIGGKLIEEVEKIREFPSMGRIVPEFDLPHIREIILIPYRIIYRLRKADRVVEIVRVWHAARGVPRI